MALIESMKGLNPEVTQIYPIVNEVYQQMTGLKDIQAVDTNSLIAMGTQLDNIGKKDIWLGTLNKRIGRTIDGYRVYDNKYLDMMRDELAWGAIVQKLYAEMPDAILDKAYDVGQMDGQSIDQWIISNPKVKQKFFDSETPYAFMLTIQSDFLDEAFLNSFAMNSLINYIFGSVKNKREFTMEELARLCIDNFILNLKPFQEYHLVSLYNATTPANAVTTQTAMADADFLRWAIGFINDIALMMENMSVLFNSENKQRFTPKSKQKLYMLQPFMNRIQTVVSYAAFNPEYVTTKPDIVVPYWQALKTPTSIGNFDTLSSIEGTIEDGTTRKVSNLIGVLYDYDALGTFKREVKVRVTPENARGLYYNTFWHERQFWFNDMGENGCTFYLD